MMLHNAGRRKDKGLPWIRRKRVRPRWRVALERNGLREDSSGRKIGRLGFKKKNRGRERNNALVWYDEMVRRGEARQCGHEVDGKPLPEQLEVCVID